MKRSNKRTAVVWILLLLMALAAPCAGETALGAEDTENIVYDQPEATETEEVTEPQPTAEPAQPTLPPENHNSTAKPSETDTQQDESTQTEAPATYTVRFLNADGSVFGSMTLQAGETIARPETDPSLDGHTFAHWYDAQAGEETPFTFGGSVTGDITLKAFFIIDADTELTGEPSSNPEQEKSGEDDPEDPDAPELEDGEGASSTVERSDLSLAHVSIWMDIDDETQFGDTVTAYCAIENFYGWEYSVQWQYKEADGSWLNVSGAMGMSHSFILTEDNLSTEWRVRVDVAVPDEVADEAPADTNDEKPIETTNGLPEEDVTESEPQTTEEENPIFVI